MLTNDPPDTQIFAKLNRAREDFHSRKLKKTGKNKFAGFEYFELGDFLMAGLDCFRKQNLCPVISFTKEIASMSIVDIDNGEVLKITSPMEGADLKGCHPIQNLGAVETYQRRYLWVTALEIVEHDALDPTVGQNRQTEKGEFGTYGRRANIEEAVERLMEQHADMVRTWVPAKSSKIQVQSLLLDLCDHVLGREEWTITEIVEAVREKINLVLDERNQNG
jgi:hypothetical protein